MRYISLFSGIEAASVAAEPLGWEPVCFCEIDEFPSAVLAHRYPEVPNLGDITKVDWKKVVAEHGPVDVVVGGSPCQSFSVAGKREGLEGASGLMFEYIRAVSEIMPRYWVWENVPGALSSSGGADFECFLGEMAGIRGAGGERYGIGWRVLDAQFFGVAQRRRRLFAVGVLGELEGPAKVLFESEGLLWDTPSSREKRQALAPDAGSGPAGADGRGGGAVAFAQNTRDEVRVQGDGSLSGALAAQVGMKQQTYVAECLTPWDVQSKRVHPESGVSPTLASGTHEGQNIQPIVMASAHSHAEIDVGGVAPSLMAHAAKQPPILATGMTCSRPSARPTGTSGSSTTSQFEEDGLYSMADDNAKAAIGVDVCGSLKVGGAPPMIASRATARRSSGPSAQWTARESGASSSARGRSSRAALTQFGDEVAGTLTARHDSSPTAQGGQNVVMTRIGGTEDE